MARSLPELLPRDLTPSYQQAKRALSAKSSVTFKATFYLNGQMATCRLVNIHSAIRFIVARRVYSQP